ncbi:Tranposase (orf2) [Streptococcus pneumoniae]|nr:Tranposase (orf2) [Streptococcus pneumoniae]
MATLQYVREYRTYEEIAADFGIHESNLPVGANGLK